MMVYHLSPLVLPQAEHLIKKKRKKKDFFRLWEDKTITDILIRKNLLHMFFGALTFIGILFHSWIKGTQYIIRMAGQEKAPATMWQGQT